jgi:hypothetical protein
MNKGGFAIRASGLISFRESKVSFKCLTQMHHALLSRVGQLETREPCRDSGFGVNQLPARQLRVFSTMTINSRQKLRITTYDGEPLCHRRLLAALPMSAH